jgi:hypothetical protein
VVGRTNDSILGGYRGVKTAVGRGDCCRRGKWTQRRNDRRTTNQSVSVSLEKAIPAAGRTGCLVLEVGLLRLLQRCTTAKIAEVISRFLDKVQR